MLEGIHPAPRGVPEIEVSFDIDANLILNVTAKDMSTSKESKITIKNEKGRLSKEDIDRMLHDAERFRADDEKRERIAAKNKLKNMAFTYKQTAEELSALSQSAKKKCDEMLDWVQQNENAEKGQLEKKLQELENVCMPLMRVLDQNDASASGGLPGARGMTGNGDLPRNVK